MYVGAEVRHTRCARVLQVVDQITQGELSGFVRLAVSCLNPWQVTVELCLFLQMCGLVQSSENSFRRS